MSSQSQMQKLNDIQYAATTHKDGPAAVYAGAGSGKTRVICARIAWLILVQNIDPGKILAVTFTNKATKEMRERIEKYSNSACARNVMVSTFHAFCAYFLRIYAHEAEFDASFSIYDDSDQKKILKDALKKFNIAEAILSPRAAKEKIDQIKNEGLNPEQYLYKIDNNTENISTYQLEYKHLIYKVYKLYQDTLKEQNALDFNDLLLVFYNIILNKTHVLTQLQKRFCYFLIDEFQDTNPIQFKLITLLSSHTKNLFIVGDDDQSIYSWRGAEPGFMLNFHNLFKDAKIYKLEENYRSTNIIIQAASSLIGYNKIRVAKELYTNNNSGNKILVKSCINAYIEADYIANKIYTFAKADNSFASCAILYRTNAQSRSIEDELRRRMLPYIIYGAVRFYERAEVKICLAYLTLLINPADNIAFEKIINTPRRAIGASAIEKLKQLAQTRNESLIQSATEIVYGAIPNPISRSMSGLKKIVQLLQKWKQLLLDGTKASVTFEIILADIIFDEYLQKTYPEDYPDRQLNIIELKNALKEFEENYKNNFIDAESLQNQGTSLEIIAKFIEHALLTVEPKINNLQEDQLNAVTLMTIHSAKGLEFDNVFIAGLEEGILPHQNSLESLEALEEERRLMYVAITRARLQLFLTYSICNRYKQFLPAQKSRFLNEIPSFCLQIEKINC